MITEADAKDAGWRYLYADGAGDLLPFCGECAASLDVSENAPSLIRFIDADYYAPLKASWRWLRRFARRSDA